MAFTTHDNAPYLYRRSGGGGDKEIDKLVGGTIAWNQLVQNGNFADTSEWRAGNAEITISSNTLTFTATNTNGGPFQFKSMSPNHVYWCVTDFRADNGVIVGIFAYDGTYHISGYTATGAKQTANYFFKSTNSVASNSFLYPLRDQRTSNWTPITLYKSQLFDLTLMFGSTIADYVYSLEQSSQGSGLAWLRSYGFLTEDYYDYNAGELKSVSNLLSHQMTGFNQWNEEWELGGISSATGINSSNTSQIRSKNYIAILPNTQYYFYVGNEGEGARNWQSRFYDAEKNYIGVGGTLLYNAEFTPPSNARYVRFAMQTTYGTTYNNDICINLSSSRNGEYEPHTLRSYPLGNVTLRGLPKLNGNALYYGGDTYESNGTVTRKYGVVDLGTLAWSYSSTANHERMQTTGLASVIKSSTSTSRLANILCSAYKTITADGTYNHGEGIGIAVSVNGTVFVYDTAYTDAASFKTAMSGVYLVYELASFATETADTYTNPQWVDPNGTERYTLSANAFPMPVGHETTYNTDMGSKTVNTQVNLSMTEPSVRQIYAKEGDTARVLNIHLDQAEEDGTLRILRPDGTEVTADAVIVPEFYDGLMAEIPSDATSVVGKCYCDVEQNGVSSMPFTLNVKKNERQ